MTSSNTAPAPVDQPDRSLPQELIDLAVLAIKRGAQAVSLGHEGLGYTFHGPIGWFLWVRGADEEGHPIERAGLVNHQIGSDVKALELPAPFNAPDMAEEPVIDELLELFQTAVKNGWDANYERKIWDFKSFERIAKERNMESPGMRHELRCHASNWGYDEAARDREDHVSTEVVLSLVIPTEPGSTEPTDPIAFADDGGEQREVDREHVKEMLNKTAPNFVPVAYFDDDLEEWVM